MRSFFILSIILNSFIASAQQSWLSDFKIYTGIGLGIGKFDRSLAYYDNLSKINHSIPFISMEYQNRTLPFSIEYDLTISNYIRKAATSKSTSQYYLHKVGIGFKLQDKVLIKIKYLINNHFNDFFIKKKLGLHASIGFENDFLLGNICENKQLNIAYRFMLYYEHTFGNLTISDKSNLTSINVSSPYRHVMGISLAIRPWTNLKPSKTPSSVLPPFD